MGSGSRMKKNDKDEEGRFVGVESMPPRETVLKARPPPPPLPPNELSLPVHLLSFASYVSLSCQESHAAARRKIRTKTRHQRLEDIVIFVPFVPSDKEPCTNVIRYPGGERIPSGGSAASDGVPIVTVPELTRRQTGSTSRTPFLSSTSTHTCAHREPL